MSTNKYIDAICLAGTILSLFLLVAFLGAERLGILAADTETLYEKRLFDRSKVHSIEIQMDDWEGFLETCDDKEYEMCTLVIDGQTYPNVAIRAKGNNSLTSVPAYGNNRYSFKVEFDHYDNAKTYYGLDKLNLNSLIHDNTMLKDYLVYQMMADFGVEAPLCSYVFISVNGEDLGLYLAVEGIEQGFLQRNYGNDYGNLYKTDSLNGGRGGANSDDVKLQYIDENPDSYSNIFNSAKTDVTEADQIRLISSLKQLGERKNLETVLDIDAVLRYFVVHNFVCNFDSYTGSMVHNYYLYEEEGKLSMIPWDYNLAFGSFQGRSDATELVNFPLDSPVSGGTLESRPMVAWIFSEESYTRLYHQYTSQFLIQYFTDGILEQMIDTAVDLISPYVQQDPTKFCTYETFEASIPVLKTFCQLRAESIWGQLEGSIPSTEEEQEADPSHLIDASELDLSTLGSMNGGAPGGGANTPPHGGTPPDGGNSRPAARDDPGTTRQPGQRTGGPASSSDAGEPLLSDPAQPTEGKPGGLHSPSLEFGYLQTADGSPFEDAAEQIGQPANPTKIPSREPPESFQPEGQRAKEEGGPPGDGSMERTAPTSDILAQEPLVLLGGSVACLAFGLLIASLYRRR